MPAQISAAPQPEVDAIELELARYLRENGTYAQAMMLHNRRHIMLAAKDVPPTIWMFDGAGLFVAFENGTFDTKSAKELLVDLRDPNTRILVGSSAEDFLNAFRKRLLGVADKILGPVALEPEVSEEDEDEIPLPRPRNPASISAAINFCDRELHGPDEAINFSAMLQEASRLAWFARGIACDVRDQAFTDCTALPKWKKFWQMLNQDRFDMHVRTCPTCRSALEPLITERQLLLEQYAKVRHKRYVERCASLLEEDMGDSIKLAAHLAKCKFCRKSFTHARESLGHILNGPDFALRPKSKA